MNEKLQKLKEQHDFEEWELLTDEAKEKRKKDAHTFLGRVQAVGRIANALGSQELKAISVIQTEKLYLDLGYANFAEFLNSDDSPVSKNQYYDRLKILEAEGEKVFDLLNEIGFAKSTRKLLGKGNIQLDGENVIVLDRETGEEVSIELKDRSRLLETLTALADANADKTRKIDSEKKKTERLENKVNELNEKIEIERTTAKLDSLDAHSSALMNLLNAFQILKTEAEGLTLVEKEQFAPRTFETIARQLDVLSVAYNRSTVNTNEIANQINDEELGVLMDG